MNVIVDGFETNISIEPSRLFKSFFLDLNNLAPKVNPMFKSFEFIEGDGGVGSVRQITITAGDQTMSAKHIVEELDEKNYVYKYKTFEGDIVGDNVAFFYGIGKIEPNPNGGSIYKYTMEVHVQKNDDPHTEAKIKHRLEGSKTIVHAVETYLIANPHEYN